jgi:chromosome segregation ATPase
MYTNYRCHRRAQVCRPLRRLRLVLLLSSLIAVTASAQEEPQGTQGITATPDETSPALVGAGDAAGELRRELEQAQAETARLGSENEAIKAQLDKISEEVLELRSARGELRQQAEQARAEAEGLRSEHQAVQAQLVSTQEEVAQLRSARDALQQRLTQTEARLQQAEQAGAVIEERLQAATLDAQQLRNDLAQRLEQVRAEAEGLRSQHQAVQAQLASTQEEVVQLRAARDALQQQITEAEGKLQQAERARAQMQAGLDASGLEARRLKHDLAGARETTDALEGQLAAMKQTLEERDRAITDMRGRLPAPEGGSVTVEQARSGAAAAARELTEALQAAAGSNSPEARSAVREAEHRLHRSQFFVARIVNARGVYRVRPLDSLAVISQRFYGDANLWSGIYEANAHVLENPDRLIPGMTLVIP